MTVYNVKIGLSGNDVHLQIVLPETCDETSFIAVSDESDRALIGIELAHGEAIAGHWPDEEEWVDRIHVPNPLGTTVTDGPYDGPKVLLVSTPESRRLDNIARHPAQDDEVALARAVGVLVEEVPQTH